MRNELIQEIKNSIIAYQRNAITDEGLEKELYSLMQGTAEKYHNWYENLSMVEYGHIREQYDENEIFKYWVENIYKP